MSMPVILFNHVQTMYQRRKSNSAMQQ